MLSMEGRIYMEEGPLLAFWPGLCLVIVVYGISTCSAMPCATSSTPPARRRPLLRRQRAYRRACDRVARLRRPTVSALEQGARSALLCQRGGSLGTEISATGSGAVATAMILKSLALTNFRGIRDLRLEFSEKVNLLAGVNGAGKTAILDCAAIMLSRFVGRLRSTKGTGRFFTDSDISNGSPETRNIIEIEFRNHQFDWSVSKTRRGRKRQSITGLKGVMTLVDYIYMKLDEEESYGLPIAVYYPTNRAVLDIPLRIRTTHPFDQLSAFDQALSSSPNSFRVFFEWFRDREDLENERRIEDAKFRDRQLQAVRTAIERFLPGCHSLKVRRGPLRMVLSKSGEELRVDQLSDGEKCTLAMVGDLARRMAIANPDLDDPLVGTGVVLIDELDLHLHPGWQRHVVSALEETFPNCQFLVSTHSPQILSHVAPGRIWLLERTRSGVIASRPADSFGQTAGRILEDIMDVPERPREIKERLSRLFLAIQQEELQTAKELVSDLTHTIGEDPDLVRARVHIRRKEALAKR